MASLIHWLLEFESGERYWSGEGDLSFGGVTWQGTSRGKGSIISIGPAENALGPIDNRLTASMDATNPTVRAAMLTDPGPINITLQWIYAVDGGSTWTRIDRKFSGRLSRPIIKDGLYTVEIETHLGDVDRGQPVAWSHEDQMSRYAGDTGMKMMRQISEAGVDIKWPP